MRGPDPSRPRTLDDSPGTPGAVPRQIVRRTLVEYAERGVLRRLESHETTGGLAFNFFWLGPLPYHLAFDQTGRGDASLSFHGLLPGVGPDSHITSDIQELLQRRTGGDLPPHRSVDPRRASVALVPEEDASSGMRLVLRIHDGDFEYGVRKLLNLVNEIWIRLNDVHQRYMWEAFDAPME